MTQTDQRTMPQIYERILRLTQPGQRTTPPIPPPKSALEAVIALAAAARQSTSDDEGTAFVVEHLRRTINAVQALEDEIVRLRKLAGEPDHI